MAVAMDSGNVRKPVNIGDNLLPKPSRPDLRRKSPITKPCKTGVPYRFLLRAQKTALLSAE